MNGSPGKLKSVLDEKPPSKSCDMMASPVVPPVHMQSSKLGSGGVSILTVDKGLF